MENRNYTREQLEAIGGNYWEGGSHRRVYFNDLAGFYGLDADRYGTGNISGATVDGKKISNSQARKIENALDTAGFYYDLNSGEFCARLSDEKMSRVVDGISAALSANEASEDATGTNDPAAQIAAWDREDVFNLIEMLNDAQEAGIGIDWANLPTEEIPPELEAAYSPAWAMDRKGRLFFGSTEDLANIGYVDGVFHPSRLVGKTVTMSEFIQENG